MIEAAFRENMTLYGMAEAIRHSGNVIVGFSGGWDSSCLLRLMKDWCTAHDITIVAAHVNHKIRGDGADRDEAFCRQVCRSLEIPLYVGVYDVPALSRAWGVGLEEGARKVRYDFFDEVSRRLTGVPDQAVIATAHNATDNAETVLFHMLRGTGLHGICGIDPIRDGRFIRPLISLSADEIRQWCRDHGIPAVTDETNTDTAYTRNKIRQELLPILRSLTASPEDSIHRMTDLLRQDDDFLNQTAEGYLANSDSPSRETFSALHPAVLSRILRIMYSRLVPGSFPDERHIRSCMNLIRSDRTDASLDLPENVTFRMDRHRVWMNQQMGNPSDTAPPEMIYDGSDYENNRYRVIFQTGISQEIQQNITSLFNNKENIYKLSIHKTFDFDKIIGALKIRTRREGDTFTYGGMTRKVKKLFIDRKLTAEEKAKLPLLCDDKGIVWIPGFPLRDGMEFTGDGTPLTVTVLEKQH